MAGLTRHGRQVGVPLACAALILVFASTSNVFFSVQNFRNIGLAAAALATMLNYAVHAENTSLYNTPPAFAVYALGLVMKWLIAQGGLPAIAAVNRRKGARLYAEIDRTGFYRGTANSRDRSLMNITFRLKTEDLEKQFVKESTAAGLDGLKGH